MSQWFQPFIMFKKNFFSWRASPRKILYLLTDDGILYYLMWTLGVPFFSNWPFVNSNQTKCLSLTKLHFQIYLLWRYGMMMIMRWKKFLRIKKKKLNYLLLLWTFFAPSTRTWTWNYFKHKYKYTYTWWSQSTLIEEFCMKRVTSRSFATYLQAYIDAFWFREVVNDHPKYIVGTCS